MRDFLFRQRYIFSCEIIGYTNNELVKIINDRFNICSLPYVVKLFIYIYHVLQKLPNYLLAIISALLLSAGWFQPFIILILFSLVPLMIIEDRVSNSLTIKRKKLKLLGLSYLTFFTWNLCVCWWIYFASLEGACMAIICNPIFMSIIFMIWHNLKQRLHKPLAIWLLVPLWLGFEYGHTLWDLTWTWLTLGNAFAFAHNWVQWYEFTGTSGGSLWILTASILVFNLIKSEKFQRYAIAISIAVV